jgi:hypothetical protein
MVGGFVVDFARRPFKTVLAEMPVAFWDFAPKLLPLF